VNAMLQQDNIELEDHEEELLLAEDKPFLLKKLRPRHMDVCALIAQGLPNVQVAQITGYTPTYICMLMRQPVCIAYVQQLNESVAARLETMFGKAVDVIATAMDKGNIQEQLKAVRLHGELTKRIGARDISPGSSEDSNARLARLSERLVGLLETARKNENGRTIDGTCETVQGSAGFQLADVRGRGEADEAFSDGERA
jgi:DNA-binding CsgD family transcriptional regulator